MHPPSRLTLLLLSLTVLPATACIQQPPQAVSVQTSAGQFDVVELPETLDHKNEESEEGAVTVRVVDETEFNRLLQECRGKVALIDFWATWCTECLELFPHTVELQERFGQRGLVVISVSLDDPDDESRVLASLVSNGAKFENVISVHGGSDDSLKAFGLEDGSLPYIKLLDRSGQLHKAFRSSQGAIDVEQMDDSVENLLAEEDLLGE